MLMDALRRLVGGVKPRRARTVVGIYRRAMWAPFVVAAVGAAVTLSLEAAGFDAVGTLFLFLTLPVVIALPPYALYLGLVMWLRRPTTESEFRRLALTAPIGSGVILVALSLVGASFGVHTLPRLREFASEFGWLTNAALVVGYVFVGAVEVTVSNFKHKHKQAPAA